MQTRYSRYQVSCFLSTNAVLKITCDTVATLHFMTKLDLMHFFFSTGQAQCSSDRMNLCKPHNVLHLCVKLHLYFNRQYMT